ncbi:hypothetical protein BD779DRAFT_1681451 [Infundibulicybe gibba]|nr:hypothetical protein BD779DRAFT_1681451 [Infundibulicybe gibba]
MNAHTDPEYAEANVRRAIQELKDAETNERAVKAIPRRKKGGGIAAKKAALKRVQDARSALSAAEATLQLVMPLGQAVPAGRDLATPDKQAAQPLDTENVTLDDVEISRPDLSSANNGDAHEPIVTDPPTPLPGDLLPSHDLQDAIGPDPQVDGVPAAEPAPACTPASEVTTVAVNTPVRLPGRDDGASCGSSPANPGNSMGPEDTSSQYPGTSELPALGLTGDLRAPEPEGQTEKEPIGNVGAINWKAVEAGVADKHDVLWTALAQTQNLFPNEVEANDAHVLLTKAEEPKVEEPQGGIEDEPELKLLPQLPDAEKNIRAPVTGVKKKRRRVEPADSDDEPDGDGQSHWDHLSEEDKEAIRVRGEKAISNFLKSNGEREIPAGLRRMIREVQELLPQAATTSRALAYSIFRTTQKNVICRYHQKFRGSSKPYDGFRPTSSGTSFIIHGPAYRKDLRKEPQPGHMHCGCAIDVALMEFYFWKTWTIRSTRPDFDYIESMREEVLPARPRAFFVQAYTAGTGLSLDDHYAANYGASCGTREYLKKLRKNQLENLIGMFNRMRDADELDEMWVLVKRPVNPDVEMGA